MAGARSVGTASADDGVRHRRHSTITGSLSRNPRSLSARACTLCQPLRRLSGGLGSVSLRSGLLRLVASLFCPRLSVLSGLNSGQELGRRRTGVALLTAHVARDNRITAHRGQQQVIAVNGAANDHTIAGVLGSLSGFPSLMCCFLRALDARPLTRRHPPCATILHVRPREHVAVPATRRKRGWVPDYRSRRRLRRHEQVEIHNGMRHREGNDLRDSANRYLISEINRQQTGTVCSRENNLCLGIP